MSGYYIDRRDLADTQKRQVLLDYGITEDHLDQYYYWFESDRITAVPVGQPARITGYMAEGG